MTKADIVDIVAEGTGLTKLETEAVVEGFFKSVIEALSSGKGIEIRGFGTFKVKSKAARYARNPKNGENPLKRVRSYMLLNSLCRKIQTSLKLKKHESPLKKKIPGAKKLLHL